MVIGAFAFCYIPAFVGILVTAKLGPSRVPNALRSAVVVMIVINSALNPIIYTFRSNEFKRFFKKIFTGASREPNNATDTAVTRLGATTCAVQSDLPSTLPSHPVASPTPVESRDPRSVCMWLDFKLRLLNTLPVKKIKWWEHVIDLPYAGCQKE